MTRNDSIRLISQAIEETDRNVGLIASYSKRRFEDLSQKELNKIIKGIRSNEETMTITLQGGCICEIETPFYNNELDITIKHKNYYN